MKVLLFSPTLEMGGAEKIISRFYFFLKKKKIDTKIVLFNNKKPYFDNGIKSKDILNLQVKRARFSILKVIKIINQENPDYILSNQREANIAVSIAKKFLFKKFKLIAREAAPLEVSNKNILNKFFLKIIYNSFDGIIFNSKFTQNSFLEKINLKNYIIINNPLLVDSKIKNNIKYKKKLKDNYKFLTCGRLHKQKNIFTLIDYFKMYKIRKPKTELHIVGDGEEKNKIITYIKKNNLNKNIFVHGSQKKLHNYYLDSDLYISTSLTEGFGNTFLEALNYNLPIISFNNGGIKDILKKNFQGKIINKNYFSFINNVNLILKKNYKILHPSIFSFKKDIVYEKYFNFIKNV